MPRFGLHEFSTPDYRGSLPAYDENNAFWPRVSAFAKMLHDMSWEDGDEYDDDTGRTEEEREADFEKNARDNVKTSEDAKMDGYSQYLENQSHLSEDDKKTQASEMEREASKEGADREKLGGYGGDRRGPDMSRMRQLAENPAQGFRNSVQRTYAENPDGTDLDVMFPDLFTESQVSKDAMKQYLDKMNWENDRQGYRPLPTR